MISDLWFLRTVHKTYMYISRLYTNSNHSQGFSMYAFVFLLLKCLSGAWYLSFAFLKTWDHWKYVFSAILENMAAFSIKLINNVHKWLIKRKNPKLPIIAITVTHLPPDHTIRRKNNQYIYQIGNINDIMIITAVYLFIYLFTFNDRLSTSSIRKEWWYIYCFTPNSDLLLSSICCQFENLHIIPAEKVKCLQAFHNVTKNDGTSITAMIIFNSAHCLVK